MRNTEIICDLCGWKTKQENAVGSMYAITVKDTHISMLPWIFATATIAHLHHKDICNACYKTIGDHFAEAVKKRDGEAGA